MAVKIIAGATDNATGVINVNDLEKMKSSFIKETTLSPAGDTRKTVVKTGFCYLFKSHVDQLFALHPEASVLKVNFALHLNPTKECGSDYSDSLTVVIEAAKNDAPDRTAFNKEGDYVLIPAYHNQVAQKLEMLSDPCCPSQGGGHPGT